ncbi:aspartate kinase [Salisediminibacterium halotolerans]|uniref:aspartate kinase n=1 Tax=Salisediminibacterium halotolerans TaxID=517425 RepID=UPI000EB421B6|nr:aspartate kinase [Salisediminibacterium halotolerans]RLJ74168.1 aspartate kinase [Actinophytocola xinjiangensis]RPE87739.1 aspartate kinase [Salisediminibacterium halotolerans]TWG35005.1 aspartate kinase [Salisediminibacterium halotolerans]GEL06708.1 aspartokinase [Salisediminibacterium halotolerans]
MRIIVQKFGGTSLQSEEARNAAAERVIEAVREGYKVVAVVSAMGRSGDPYATDTLMELVGGIQSTVTKQDQDLLLSCGETISSVVFSGLLQSKGLRSMAMNGAQAGFRTTEQYGDAKILDMKTDGVKAALAERDVVVVTGFQGETVKGTIATLGRGGSDTSATALGASLQAEVIDIFTDVAGVMTADPRIVPDARTLSSVTYNEISNLAHQGAKVIHPRAVEVAMQAEVPIRIRSLFDDGRGTLVSSTTAAGLGRDLEERPVTGIAHVSGLAQVNVDLTGLETAKTTAAVFQGMADSGISVDFITIQPDFVQFTVPNHLIQTAESVLTNIGIEVTFLEGCTKVSAVGAGMTGVPGITASIVQALADENISILQSADSHTTIWVLVKETEMKKAVNALHRAFLIEEEGE